MILCDWLSLKQDNDGARSIILKGERNITTACLDKKKKREISGTADYVMGYGNAPGLEDKANPESTFVVIEAKKRPRFRKEEHKWQFTMVR